MDATYTFEPDTEGRDALLITAHVGGQARPIVVAELHDPASSMPGLVIKAPLGVNAVEEVCAIIRAAFIGPRTGDKRRVRTDHGLDARADVANAHRSGQGRRP
jgi:hypothetical protein